MGRFGVMGSNEKTRKGKPMEADLSTSHPEIPEYPPEKVASDDDFGTKLMVRKGRIAKDVDLEF